MEKGMKCKGSAECSLHHKVTGIKSSHAMFTMVLVGNRFPLRSHRWSQKVKIQNRLYVGVAAPKVSAVWSVQVMLKMPVKARRRHVGATGDAKVPYGGSRPP